MKKCKYCAQDIFKEKDLDGTYEEGYCDKLHRKSHEIILNKDGKMEGLPKSSFNILVDSNIRDIRGDLIDFPKNNQSYFDKALQKTFHSKKEKAQYMKKHNMFMDGSSDSKHNPPEAGDTRGSRPTYSTPK